MNETKIARIKYHRQIDPSDKKKVGEGKNTRYVVYRNMPEHAGTNFENNSA